MMGHCTEKNRLCSADRCQNE